VYAPGAGVLDLVPMPPTSRRALKDFCSPSIFPRVSYVPGPGVCDLRMGPRRDSDPIAHFGDAKFGSLGEYAPGPGIPRKRLPSRLDVPKPKLGVLENLSFSAPVWPYCPGPGAVDPISLALRRGHMDHFGAFLFTDIVVRTICPVWPIVMAAL